ncbi:MULTISPECIES: 3-phosphoshikimate 1-carboxyvinyltransferase [Sellimonas]|uniref:3-phosphoshikimate 1-carboxyvinyltransferase n=1 Tax=Sellimonas caecigallum TaxID=2592333 RepID=A0ABS7L5N3_9FIRM|nr:3-phosphoshikimate 1-carboxyvinyltransferase [Sellimonas caecigallum]MBY0758335.1 3-phosphoshikimate 1-carboxyvinyltransferase [Sellimonas caecigallum]
MTQLTNSAPLRGEITIPGDKSISHRSVMFGALSKGTTEITNFLYGADCLSTIGCFRQMGIDIEQKEEGRLIVHGKGMRGLSAPGSHLDVGNSGTTTRLISGILSAQPFTSVLSGDDSLNSRPMGRIITPLTRMGAKIESIRGDGCAPLRIDGTNSLHGITYHSPVASAQVKSSILLAGLYADGVTSVTEPVLSRNHTELMLCKFGASVSTEISADASARISILPCQELYGQKIHVPGDISSAAYFIAAALLVPGSELLIKNVGTNPTRAGILKVCQDMGADITYVNETAEGGEQTADLLVRSSSLHGTVVEGRLIPTLIDEIPMIAVLAAFADGTTVIRDAAELKVKETDRIRTVTENLTRMGGDVTPTEDGMIIRGGKALHGTVINPYLDHRIAMAFSVAALASDGVTDILDSSCVDVSYPGFFASLKSLTV